MCMACDFDSHKKCIIIRQPSTKSCTNHLTFHGDANSKASFSGTALTKKSLNINHWSFSMKTKCESAAGIKQIKYIRFIKAIRCALEESRDFEISNRIA